MTTKVKANSREILQGLIAKGFTAVQAAQTLGINYNRFRELLKNDRQITTKTAGKLVKFFGERVVYIDDGAIESGTNIAGRKNKQRAKTVGVKGHAGGNRTCSERHAPRAEIDAENRSVDVENPGA